MIIYGEAENIPKEVESTVFSATNSGSVRQLKEIGICGSTRTLWYVYLNNNRKLSRRTTTANSSLPISFYNLLWPAGGILDIKVVHYQPTLQNFEVEVIYNG